MAHDREHDIDDPNNHGGVTAAVEGNFMEFDANGLPRDSGVQSSDLDLIIENTVQTTDDTPTIITNHLVQDNVAGYVQTTIVGRQTNGANAAAYVLAFAVYRYGGSPPDLIGPIESVFTRETTGGWAVTFEIVVNNIVVKVKGSTGQTIDWKARHITVRVIA